MDQNRGQVTPDIKSALITSLALSELKSVSLAEAERKIGRRVIMMFPEALKALYRSRRHGGKRKRPGRLET
ncbi:MAG: hypothetical protein ACT4N4_18325 [Rhodospirillales bacterium]